VSGFVESLIHHSFLQHALIGGLLASIGCGVMGTFVVVKRIGYLAGGIAHSVLGGMGIAYFLGKNPIAGALLAAMVAALIIGWVKLRWHQQEDTIIGALWSVGMAIGILFISRTPGYNVDLMSYLFGNILLIPAQQLYLLAAMDGLIIALVALFYKQLLAVAFDEEFAYLRGVPVEAVYLLLLSLVALTVVILIQVVGLILVIALLTLPAAITAQYVRSLAVMMMLAAVLAMVFTVGGLAMSFNLDLPSGATITLFAGVAYLGATLMAGFLNRWRIARGVRS
jgi:zinc transport system permease protein